MVNKRAVCSGVLVGIGLVLAVGGLVMVTYGMPQIIRAQVTAQVSLGNDSTGHYSDTTNKWIKPPFPITMSYMMFNITNTHDILNGHKPNVVEMGPYVYNEINLKNSLEWSADGSFVKYRDNKAYLYNEVLSGRSDKEMVTTVNPILLTFADMLIPQNFSALELVAISGVLAGFGESLFVTHTVDELIYNGYDDKLLKLLGKLHLNLTHPLPPRGGFQVGINNTDDGLFEIYTGKNGHVDKVGGIVTYNGEKQLPLSWWGDKPQARKIMGSDGTLNPPFLDMDTRLYMFIPEICRSVYITPKQRKVDWDIPVIQFSLPPEIWDANLEENKVFCNPADDGYFPELQVNRSGCLPSGLLDIGRCQGAPVIVSSPHFLFAPDGVINSINGMRPDEKKHTTVVELEPNTAVGVYLSRRIQINMKMPHFPFFGDLSNVNSHIIPILWLNETGVIDQGPGSTHEQITGQLLLALKIGNGATYGLLAVGAFILIAGLIGVLVILYENHSRSNNGGLLNRTESEENLPGVEQGDGGYSNEIVA